jgi:hypothetical protein
MFTGGVKAEMATVRVTFLGKRKIDEEIFRSRDIVLYRKQLITTNFYIILSPALRLPKQNKISSSIL